MGCCVSFMLLIAFSVTLLLLNLHHQSNAAAAPPPHCNFFQGKWVVDSSYPLYNSLSCPFIEKEFNCLRNGRPDQEYLKYRWQPDGCDLAKFDGVSFLQKFKGKSILFAGDSLTRDQYMSLACMLQSSVPHTNYTMIRQGLISTLTFSDYGVKIILDRNVFLVDLATENNGTVLKIDTISPNSKLWAENDMLVFNTWHWWNYKGAQQPWKYIELGGKLYEDMNRTVAFEIGLKTWANWVDTTINPSKTKVFFQGVSPSHYVGEEWHQKGAKCAGQKLPLMGSTYPGGLPSALGIQKSVVTTMSKPVTFLDITTLSQLRIDGHPSFYGAGGKTGMDCTHWCLAGVPDTWNTILYNFIF